MRSSALQYLQRKLRFHGPNDLQKSPSVWILYDFLYCRGGAEYTSLVLQKYLKEAVLCVDFINREHFSSLPHPNLRILGSAWDYPVLKTLKGLWDFRFRTHFLANCKAVIYSGSNAIVAVHNQKKGKRILYCHTIPRFAYDMKEYYKKQIPFWQYPAFALLCHLVQYCYYHAFNKMDIVVANSFTTHARLKQYFNKNAIIVYPPVDTDKYVWRGQKNYYLSTARLEAYKRVDIIIKAFREMPDCKLVIASGGSDASRLKKLADGASNIIFTGWLTPAGIQKLTGSCIASIYMAKDEDFGISPVESMAAGKPVIGAAEGGLLETILEGQTGLLIVPTPENIVNAVRYLNKDRAQGMRTACERRASLFHREHFLQAMRRIIFEDVQPSEFSSTSE